MSCCGDKRAAARTAFERPSRAPSPSLPSPVLERPVAMAFTGDGPLVVRGSITGLSYAFPAGDALEVDYRDAAGFLSSGTFRLA
ncbi:MAG: hypothetical protein IT361_04905 [Gemmatimonadaceae bacterium]|nr:hypothetical protein [Gemmatimonadaceae bacterium]